MTRIPWPRTEAEYRAITGPDDWTPPLDALPCQCGHGLFRHSKHRSRKAPCNACDCAAWREKGLGL